MSDRSSYDVNEDDVGAGRQDGPEGATDEVMLYGMTS
jgi:hypothetical protein